MDLETLRSLQAFFLEAVQLHPSRDLNELRTKPESRYLTERYWPRLQAYRTSHYARLTSGLRDYLFTPACLLLGEELIEQLLVEYFSARPSTQNMIDSVRAFPHFLREHPCHTNIPFLSDITQFCVDKHDIMQARDPDPTRFLFAQSTQPQPHEIFLQREHVLFISEWPIYQFWETTQALEKKHELKEVELKAETILLFKSSPLSVEVLLVPQVYVPLAQSLSTEKSFAETLEQFKIPEEFDEAHFTQWIGLLTQRGGLTHALSCTN